MFANAAVTAVSPTVLLMSSVTPPSACGRGAAHAGAASARRSCAPPPPAQEVLVFTGSVAPIWRTAPEEAVAFTRKIADRGMPSGASASAASQRSASARAGVSAVEGVEKLTATKATGGGAARRESSTPRATAIAVAPAQQQRRIKLREGVGENGGKQGERRGRVGGEEKRQRTRGRRGGGAFLAPALRRGVLLGPRPGGRVAGAFCCGWFLDLA